MLLWQIANGVSLSAPGLKYCTLPHSFPRIQARIVRTVAENPFKVRDLIEKSQNTF